MSLASRSRALAAVAAVAVVALSSIALLACGGDSDDTSTAPSTDATAASGGEGLDPELAAQSLADCTTAAGLEGTVTSGSDPNAVPVDMTTETATIVVQVFATDEEASSYKSESGLDQEVVANYVILGGAIPKKEHEIITRCIDGS